MLVPFLDDRPDDKPCFSPKEAEAWRYADRPPYSGRERTAKDASETKRLAERKAARREAKRKPGRKCCGQYDRDSDRRTVRRGVEKAKAAEVRKAAGPEAAHGHKNAGVTQVYAEKNLAAAVELAKATGWRHARSPPSREDRGRADRSCPDPAGTPLTGGDGRGRGGVRQRIAAGDPGPGSRDKLGGNPELPGGVIAARCVSPSGFDDEPCPPPRRRIGRTFRTTA